MIRRKDGGEERMLEYSNQLGLQLLKMHRETAIEADSEMPEEDVDEIRERLVKKLQRLKKRDEEQEARRAELRVMRHERRYWRRRPRSSNARHLDIRRPNSF